MAAVIRVKLLGAKLGLCQGFGKAAFLLLK